MKEQKLGGGLWGATGQLFEMIRLDIREVVGKYLTTMMNAELTHYLGREPYVRVVEAVNHRNGSCGRGFTC
jgi:putative transposase